MIDEFSSLGEQIKYYREKQDIKQTDLSLKLGYARGAIRHLENDNLKLIDVNLIKAVIKELNIKDKIYINDDYIEFLLNKPCENIANIRKEMKLTKVQFAKLLNVSLTSVKRWENGNSHISRSKYNELRKCMS